MLSHALPQRYQPTSGRYTLGERDVNERSHRCTAQILKSDGKVSCSQTFLPWGTSHHVLLKMVTFSFLFFLTRVFTIVMRKLQLHHDSHESIYFQYSWEILLLKTRGKCHGSLCAVTWNFETCNINSQVFTRAAFQWDDVYPWNSSPRLQGLNGQRPEAKACGVHAEERIIN